MVVRISQEGGFAPAGALFGRVPDLLVTGDGRVFRPGVQTMIFPGPLLPAISVGSITPTGIDRLLAVAQTNGLLTDPPPEYAGNPQVADVTTTVVDLRTDAGPFHHAAYGLGFVPDGQGDPAKELTPTRGQLLTFVNAAQDLAAHGRCGSARRGAGVPADGVPHPGPGGRPGEHRRSTPTVRSRWSCRGRWTPACAWPMRRRASSAAVQRSRHLTTRTR